MLKVNLLDWRYKRVTILNRRFFSVIAISACLGVLISIIISFTINVRIQTVLDNIAYLNKELASVEGKIKEIDNLQSQKKILLSRRELVASLQTSRSIVVKIFDNLVHAMPEDVILNSLVRKDNSLVIDGSSNSNYSITVLMENIQQLSWVKEAQLGEIKGSADEMNPKNPSDTTIKFKLNILIAPSAAGGDNAAT